MLSDREKFILHFVAFISSPDVSDPLISKIMYEVTHSRCRSIAPEDVMDIIEEINEEIAVGKAMFEQVMKYLKSDQVPEWIRDGIEHPNKNTNMEDACNCCLCSSRYEIREK